MNFRRTLLTGIAVAAAFAASAVAQDVHVFWNKVPLSGPGGWISASPSTPLIVSGITDVDTYSGGVGNLANTGAGDIFCITGSDTRLVKVKAIRFSAIATAGNVVDALAVRRSSAASGGTPVAVTIGKNDTLNPNATATVVAYSTSPTPGTTVAVVRGVKLAVGTPGNTTTIADEEFNFSRFYGQPIVLRSSSESLCINVTALGSGASIDIGEEHTEE